MTGVLIAPLALIGCFCALIVSQLHHENRPPPDTPIAVYAPLEEFDTAAPALTPTPAPTPEPSPTPPPAYVAPPPPPRAVVTRPAPTAAPQRATPQSAPIPLRVTAQRADIYDVVAAYFPEQPDSAYRRVICESGGNPGAVNPNGHYGLWQFDYATWASVGGTGNPAAASAEEQTMRARMLYNLRGWQPWECRG